MMNLPHLFGTRRVGPDLIREAGKHSNDWHMAHLYDPRSVAPYSVMPAYPWFFDAERRPTERALALVAYLQWLGSWVEQVPATIYNVDAAMRRQRRWQADAAPAAARSRERSAVPSRRLVESRSRSRVRHRRSRLHLQDERVRA